MHISYLTSKMIAKAVTPKKAFLFSLTALAISLVNCAQTNATKVDQDALYKGFVSPPAEARPFVRWWWNGDHINAGEIARELDVLQKAGIGGMEINPIAMPEDAVDIGTKPVVWLSPEWNKLVAGAAWEAQKRGMITDLIVGSGWPFGGEFLKESETVQRVITHSINYPGGTTINENKASLIQKAFGTQKANKQEEALSNEILFASLVPLDTMRKSAVIDLTGRLTGDQQLSYDLPQGSFRLIYGIRQRGHRQVLHGALGAAGPVMNHYDRDITLAYLNRLKKISDETGIPLSKLFRALFCDSIELAGANWTDGFEEIFYDTYHYRIEPYFPYVFYDSGGGYAKVISSATPADEIKRVRYDYNKLLVKVFLKNFTTAFQDFCTENGVKCRYQAYGIPFLMGMTEGNMIPDIPESNNWIYSVAMNSEEWIWNQNHGYMIWNLYAAAGGHLTARKIISCEAMTNTRGVFKTSLEEIKREDDMNFITGINHTVLHGFNYSPPGAGFPGWVRYGSYFSEQNPWWPYFSKWVDYNARLSYVFQNSQPEKNIAILGPVGDLWSEKGLTRAPFHTEPWYCYRLWEPLSQAGSSCDYIDEKIIQKGLMADGTLKYGPMTYQSIFLSSFRSIEPETALALLKFVEVGGKLVMIDGIPSRSLSLKDAVTNDVVVQKAFAEMKQKYPERLFVVDSPAKESDLLSWTQNILKQISIRQDVNISVPDKNVFQIRKKDGEKQIFFFVNSHLTKSASLAVSFPTDNKTPWIWNPEDGSRKVFPYGKSKNRLSINLKGLESMLLVFEPGMDDKPAEMEDKVRPEGQVKVLENSWQVKFDHMNGTGFERSINKLFDFGTSGDGQLNTFAGTITYRTTFNSDYSGGWLQLGKVNKGVTEVFLNGKPVGVNWYGQPVFCLDNVMVSGENRLEIRYTTVLSNYCRSLKNNPTAEKWTKGYDNIPMGLEGACYVRLTKQN